MDKILQDLKIGDNIRKLRKNNHMTQPKVVAKLQLLGCQIDRSGYAKIESGYRNIRVSELILLKHIFKVNYEDFFDGLIPPETEELLREYELMK